MEKEILVSINNQIDTLKEIADYIFDNPETGNNEFLASECLCENFRKNGFDVEKGVGGLKTSFRAKYKNSNGGIRIGLLCEYDALDVLGHACGHHLQGPVMLGAACAIKEAVKDIPYELVIYGTPAEETTSGKIKMIENGCFKDIDIALMMHAHSNTTVNLRTLSVTKFTVTFEGVSSHAALRPEDGRSALDGLLLAFQGIEFLREHVRDDVRMHYTVLNAGGSENTVPKTAVGSFRLRSLSNSYLDDLVERFKCVIKGAAMMTGTKADIHLDKQVLGRVPVETLNDLLMKHAGELNAINISDPPKRVASNDFGNVSHIIPSAQIKVALVPEGTSAHSQKFIEEGKSDKAKKCLEIGAEIIALTCYDLINDPSLLCQCKEDFQKSLLDCKE